MRRYGFVTLRAGLLLAARAAAVAGPEFRDLFSGRDLTGWVNVNIRLLELPPGPVSPGGLPPIN